MRTYANGGFYLAMGLLATGFGCSAKKAPIVPPVDPATVVAAIDPSLKPADPPSAQGLSAWDKMAKAVEGSQHSKDDLDIMGNAISANLKSDLLQTAKQKADGFKDDIDKLEACLKDPK